MNFSTNLRRLRTSKSLSQAGLAMRAGLKASLVSRLENETRRPSAEHLVRLSDALGVSADYLLARDIEWSIGGPAAKRVAASLQTMSTEDLELLATIAEQLVRRKSGEYAADAVEGSA